MVTVNSRGCEFCIQDLSSCIQIIIAMEDLLKQQFQKGFPPTVLPIGVACDGTCSIDANLIICLWCAHPLAVCSATPCSPNSYVDHSMHARHRSNLRPRPSCCEFDQSAMKQMKVMKSLQQEQLVPTVGTAI